MPSPPAPSAGPRSSRAEVVAALRALRVRPGPPLRLAALASLALAVPDLARQLPVREDATLAASLAVDAVGVVTAAVVQVGLVGAFAGARVRTAVPAGLRLLREALRRRAGAVLLGLVLAGAVSGLITLTPSVAVLGYDQVLGPLEGPALWRLLVAQASDTVATALTAAYWALLVVRCAGARPAWR